MTERRSTTTNRSILEAAMEKKKRTKRPTSREVAFSTPIRPPPVLVTSEKAKAVDLVTGKAKIEYFFDPSLLLDKKGYETPMKAPKSASSSAPSSSSSSSSSSTPYRKDLSSAFGSDVSTDPLLHKHLFMPCSIIKPLDDESGGGGAGGGGDGAAPGVPFPGPTLVKTSDGTLHKVSDSTRLIPLVSPEDYLGIDDVLNLPSVSEASLLHTLRLRYKRDDIYTSAGPILISINPYRTIMSSSSSSSGGPYGSGGSGSGSGGSGGGGGDTLYSERQMIKYRDGSDAMDALPPHLFQVADRAYTALLHSVDPSAHNEDGEATSVVTEHQPPPGVVRNQSIVISGESGAGKTEATKIIMQYLARITKRSEDDAAAASSSADGAVKSSSGKMIAALEDRVLSSNPLLETFGNAQTLRNDNSSRFGKFIHIFFSTERGCITAASISNYLLEKTRITHQIDGERNYHIFYQLFAGAGSGLLSDLGFTGGSSSFRYLGHRDYANKRDAPGFLETRECLSRMDLDDEAQRNVLGVVAAVLHLGNIEFEEKGMPEGEDDHDGQGENAVVSGSSRHSLTKACDLLGLDEAQVEEAIVTKILTIGGKTIHKPQSIDQAADKRDAFAKMTYSCLFLWLVERINETLSMASEEHNEPGVGSENQQTGFIGVLDIYGFEVFDTNGFEQFLINYCNEKLQRHFNKHLFEVEQDLYSSEGVDWTYITFNDNRPCLELVEGGGGLVGILNTLDDSWGGMGTISEKDVKFVGQLHKLYGSLTGASASKGDNEGGHQYFVTPKFSNDRQFIIRHYAGDVRYTATGFVEKNMETLSNELKDLGEQSKIPLTKSCYACGASFQETSTTSGRRSTIRGVSVGSQFRTSLQALVDDLEQTQPHYIRCIKPNLNKSPNSLDSGEVLRQLRYSGMMEAIRIRREGYALRENHRSFFNRFSILLHPEETGKGAGIEQLVKVLSKRLSITDVDWQIGHSKIFLRKELADKLERLARLRVHAAARTLGRFGRDAAQRRASKVLVAFVRFRLHMIDKRRRYRAASKIAATYRAHKQTKKFRGMRAVITTLQSFQRRRKATRVVQKIRDPYGDMTFKELCDLLKREQAKLDNAIARKDFQKAAELEETIKTLSEVVEENRPWTRPMLEEKIESIQEQLDAALQQRDFEKCTPLQEELDKLIAKREDLPTVEELKQALEDIEKEVADAVSRRDFSVAANGQARVDAAKQRLNDAIAAEAGVDELNDAGADEEAKAFGYASRAELERDLTSLNKQIKEALAAKDFKTAGELQETLDQKEKLREHFPTVQELESQVAAARDKLAKAIAEKNFAVAGKLQDALDALEKRVAAEKEVHTEEVRGNEETPSVSFTFPDGSVKTFESRADLENAVKDATKSVAKAVASKNFKDAKSLQGVVDSLVELRPKLPSAADLAAELKTVKKEMDKAISAKDFSLADDLHAKISTLEERLAAERKKVSPKPVSTPVATSQAPSVRAKSAPNVGQPPVTVQAPLANVTVGVKPAVDSSKIRTVAKLRPSKPVLLDAALSIVDASKMMSSKRSRAAIIPTDDGGVAGLVTDAEVVCRAVVQHMNPMDSSIESVMIPDPPCATLDHPASEALTMMIDNDNRHLPVVDNEGKACGLLDIGRCLNDAIHRLEKSEDKKPKNVPGALLEAANLQGGLSTKDVAALQALLGPLLAQTKGSASTTLQSLVNGKNTAIVSPGATVLAAAEKMVESRHAALIVDGQRLAGILSFKDIMSRVIAKDLVLEETTVSAVMTPNPESVLPDCTPLEALQFMYDHTFWTLPVCHANGRIAGVVDVMDVIYGCGGTEGWQSIFNNSMDNDDVSVANSAEGASGRGNQKDGSTAGKQGVQVRPVSKLRPKKPLISSVNDSILAVTQMLAHKRGDASLVINSKGGLAGIITDTDITKRVVAKNINPSSINISDVMTPDPTCVSMSDSAIDAISTMVEKHFRHLPVVDDAGAIVGLLDIAKCLNDAITKLERSHDKSKKSTGDAVLKAAGVQGAGGAQAAALQALLGPLLSQAFGEQGSPKLRSLVAGKATTAVAPTANLREVGLLMTERRKAALIVEDGHLVGIFGFKDMMTRAVAKELPLELTEVSSVMTANPEFVSPEMTVLEALQMMHDHRFLTLPVCEDDGTIVGIVDVLDLIIGCGGAEGWRSVFSNVMDDADDASDASSVVSSGSASLTRSAQSSSQKQSNKQNVVPVSKLRPKKPLLSNGSDSVLALAQMLSNKRGVASLVVDAAGGLAGIITDSDITRRVVAKSLEPSAVEISAVMSANPTCVSSTDSAMDAVCTMVEKGFRHLPVVDGKGAVMGVLDISKCLNDAITKLERSQEKGSQVAEDAILKAANMQGANAAALQELLGPLFSSAVGAQGSPKIRSLIAGRAPTTVPPTASVREAGILMAARRKPALIVDDGRLVGIFGFKDMMTRAVAKDLPLELTEVSSVMTPNPDFVSPEVTVLEALQLMHDNRFLTLPVCEENGTVAGIVDVLDLINGCGGAAGFRSLMTTAMDFDDDSESQSIHSRETERFSRTSKRSKKPRDKPVSKLRPKKPVFLDHTDTVLSAAKKLVGGRGTAAVVVDESSNLVGVVEHDDFTRRFLGKHQDPSTTSLHSIMKANPTCVSSADSAMEALTTMIETRSRHLPVLSPKGDVSGLLDIGKCLHNAISKLEGTKEKSDKSAQASLQQVADLHGANGSALQALLGPLITQALGGQTFPVLRTLVAGYRTTLVTPDTSVYVVAEKMTETCHAALIVEESGHLVGILSFKDIMSRVIAKELPFEDTLVSSVMTPSPDSVLPDCNVLEALQYMHDHNFLSLPVVESDGTVLGIVDVMDVIYGCGGPEGWQSIFNSAIDDDEDSVSAASRSCKSDDDDMRKMIAYGGDEEHFANQNEHEHETNVQRDEHGQVTNEEAWIVALGEEDDDEEEVSSEVKPLASFAPGGGKPQPVVVPRVMMDAPMVGNQLGNIPRDIEINEDDQQSTIDSFIHGASREFPGTTSYDLSDRQGGAVFKLAERSGVVHRIRCELSLKKLHAELKKKMSSGTNVAALKIKYMDEDGDEITIASDDDLIEAVNLGRKAGSQVIKLSIASSGSQSIVEQLTENPMVLAGAGAAVAVIGVGLVMMRPKRNTYYY